MNNRGRTSPVVLVIIGLIVAVAGFYCGIFLKENLVLGFDPAEIVGSAVDKASTAVSDALPSAGSDSAAPVYLSREENICKIRDSMLERQTGFTIKFSDSNVDYISNTNAFFDDYMKPAMSEDYRSGCYSGDYLSNNVKSYYCKMKRLGNDYEIVIDVAYRDDYSQEQMLDGVIKQAVSETGMDAMSEADKVKTIYRFITNYVTYDEAAEAASLAGTPEDIAHTAYGALINGKAVCQGFACLFYAMCENVGIEARIISGTADNGETVGDHAWNKVKIDGTWYCADVTWDTCRKSPIWKYYLISEEEMGVDHFPESTE